MRITVLGTGLMGAPMARRLAKAGHRLTVWNRTRGRAEALADLAVVAETPAQAVAQAELVLVMLLDGPATRTVLEEALLEVPKGATVLDMGSVDPETDRDLSAKAAERGVRYMDAPVSGGVVGAEEGTLSIFVGGNAEDLVRLRPILGILGRPTHLGPVGAGQATKLANQIIVATTIGAVAEGLRLAEAAGCDPAAVREALRGGFADSRILELHGKRMVEQDYVPGARSTVQLKDIVNALNLAARHNLDLPLGRTIEGAFRDLVDHHDGADLDHSAYHLWLEKRR